MEAHTESAILTRAWLRTWLNYLPHLRYSQKRDVENIFFLHYVQKTTKAAYLEHILNAIWRFLGLMFSKQYFRILESSWECKRFLKTFLICRFHFTAKKGTWKIFSFFASRADNDWGPALFLTQSPMTMKCQVPFKLFFFYDANFATPYLNLGIFCCMAPRAIGNCIWNLPTVQCRKCNWRL